MNHEDSYGNLSWSGEFHRFYQKVLAFAIKLKNGNQALAEDLIQIMWIKILLDPEKLAKLSAARNRSAFFCQALKRLDIDLFRKNNAKKRKADIISFETDDEGNGLISTLASKEPSILDTLTNRADEQSEEDLRENREEALRTFVGNLQGQEREIFELYLEDKNCDEIGTELKLDPRVVTYELRSLRDRVKYNLTKKKNRDQ
jgi:RNA polymerase sigma factor (sigma-70 family)